MNNMRVFYDHQVFSVQQHGGISRYFTELIMALRQVPGFTSVPGIMFSNNAYLQNSSLFDTKRFFPKHRFPGKQTLLWSLNSMFCSLKIKNAGYDLLHPTYYHPGCLSGKGSKPLVVTFHDMIYERFPEMFPVNDPLFSWKKEMAKRADRIIAVSMATRDDVVNMLGVDERKVEVVHHGNSLWPDGSEQSTVDRPSWPQRFILYVGRRDGHKNFYRFIKVMAALFTKRADLMLVCAGGGRFSVAEQSFLKAHGIRSRVIQKDYCDIELINVYSHALCLVLPSLYEGFGIPLLEAFACSCPVVCSHAGSLPEIAGIAARFFNPLSETEMLSAIMSVIDNKQTADSLRALGRIRLKDFTWSQTAEQTYAVYEQVV